MKIRDLYGRSDYAIIGDIVGAKSRVLDLGCGEGELLAWLIEHKQVAGRGVEFEADKVRKAIARGVSVYQGDFEKALERYPDQAFDYAILSQTLQETRSPVKVLRDMLRTARHGIVAFPNFGHWRVRWSHLVSGRSPRTPLFPYHWYDSPNIHFLTVEDFELLAQEEHWRIEKRIFLRGHRTLHRLPNLRAETAVYLFSR